MTESLEDYLEAIGDLGEGGILVRVTDVAARLRVSKPAVHNALHLLESRGLIEHRQYGTIQLTERGRLQSRAIRGRHDTLKHFLEGLLGVGPEAAEREACAMEHDLSDDTIRRIGGLLTRFADTPSGTG